MFRTSLPFCVIFLLLNFSCRVEPSSKPANDVAKTTPAATAADSQSGVPGSTPMDSSARTAALKCQTTEVGKLAIDRKQTFALDLDPFKGSCFVTTHDPEYNDPPLDSHFAIYKNGKRVFDFPSQFNGVSYGCWIEAVSFVDLNADALKDVIIVAKCSAKTAPYNENMVYTNTGKGFETRVDANYQLVDLKTTTAIADFVKENRLMFFDN